MKKLFPISLSIIIIYLGISQKELLLDILKSDSQWAILISILFVAILVFFPVVPYVVLAGMIGSVFGIWMGTGISLIGIGLGVMTMFILSRYGFQEWAQSYQKKHHKVQDYEILFEQNAFLGILLARVIPIIPSPIINILSGLSKVKWTIFLSASLIGKLPAIFLFTLAGSLIGNQKWISIVIYGIYFLTIAILSGRKIQQKQQKQLAERII
jgi:uncharacterized membrane protein YdjX (TVP38/TMEM64 family)